MKRIEQLNELYDRLEEIYNKYYRKDYNDSFLLFLITIGASILFCIVVAIIYLVRWIIG